MSKCHSCDEVDISQKNLVLVGNPNSGKSVIFHHLTGIYTNVSNYPGTTLQLIKGRYKSYDVIDTPGVYGISSISTEEKVTKDIILKASKIINIVNAMHLDRELFLTLQLLDMGLPVLVVLNFMDEAEKSAVKIDIAELSIKLGVKVIPCVAINGIGLKEIKENIVHIRSSKINYTYSGIDISIINNKAEQILASEGDKEILSKYNLDYNISPDNIYQQRRQRVNEIVSNVKVSANKTVTLKEKLSSLMIHPIFGFVLLGFVLYLAYLLVGVLVAQTIVGFTEVTVMKGYFIPSIQKMIGYLSLPLWLNTIIVGEFGVLTMTFGYVFGLLLPLVISFYLLLAIMEDTGYLPRLAFLIDRWLNKLGLNGKAVIPLILGFGCVTMATITTRMLDTKRERDIASALLNFAVPCSAQLAVITALMATAGGLFTLGYISIIFAFFVILGTVLNKYIAGKSSALILTLPSLQMPKLKNLALKTYVRTKHFLAEALVWFFIGALLISVFQLTGILYFLERLISPIIIYWLNLPKEAAIAYIMGIVRRDFGAAGFYNMALSNIQLLVALVSITLFVPCIAAIMILYKERGSRIATSIWVGTIVVSFFVSGILNKIMLVLNGI